MERLKAGYSKLKGEINHVVAAPVMQKLMPVHGRQYSIGSRVVIENRQISEGGFAFVYLVHDAKTNEELVLKKMRCQDKNSMALAKREIQLLEQLPPHPNLVQYYGSIFLSEGKCKEVGMLFEFCPGGHLLNLLDRAEGRLTESVIVNTMTQIVAGVAVLHSFSPPVQHRDLKVENVMLGADGQWKLLDFGSWSDERLEPGNLDKHALSQLEEQIEKYTTMMYRPPEMVDFYLEFPICQKVDIWMIGCILYTLMFYRHPFQDESTLAIANARYVWPSSPEYAEHLRDLTHWLLARDPEDRPDAELLLDILGTLGAQVPTVLPLPKAVQEQCQKLRRLYGEGRSGGSPTSRVQSPCARSQGDEEERRRSKDKRGRQNSKKKTADMSWPSAQADTSAWPATASAVPEPSSSWAAFGVQDVGGDHEAPPSPWRDVKSTWPSEGTAPDDLTAAYGDQAEEIGQSSWSFSTHATSSGSQSPQRRHRQHRDQDTDVFTASWPEVREEANLWPGPVESTERSNVTVPWPMPDKPGSPHQNPWQGSPSHSPRNQAAAVWPSSNIPFPFASPWDNTPVASPRSSERDMPSPGGAATSSWPAALAPWPDEAGPSGTDNFWGTKKATPWTRPSEGESPVVSQSFPWPVRIEAPPQAAPESPSAASASWPLKPSPWGPC